MKVKKKPHLDVKKGKAKSKYTAAVKHNNLGDGKVLFPAVRP